MAQGQDIFGYNRAPKPSAVFSTENSKLLFAGGFTPAANVGPQGAKGYLVQNWNITYQQQVQEIFELGSNALYWVKGRPQGTGTIARVVGPRDASRPGTLFPVEAFDICEGGVKFELKVKSGNCGSVGSLSFQQFSEVGINMDGCVITSIGFSADVNDTRVVENIAWRFAFLEVTS
jgi:hypothetical protein